MPIFFVVWLVEVQNKELFGQCNGKQRALLWEFSEKSLVFLFFRDIDVGRDDA